MTSKTRKKKPHTQPVRPVAGSAATKVRPTVNVSTLVTAPAAQLPAPISSVTRRTPPAKSMLTPYAHAPGLVKAPKLPRPADAALPAPPGVLLEPGPAAVHTTSSDGGGCTEDLPGPRGLSATYWFDSGLGGDPYSVSIRFEGTRIGGDDAAGLPDRFDNVEQVRGILPGSGSVAVTTRIHGVGPGSWQVIATPTWEVVDPQLHEVDRTPAVPGRRPSRQVEISTTRPSPFVHGPSVRLGAWPALVGLGALVGIIVQALLVARAGLDVFSTVALSLTASVLGLIGAKTYFLVQHRQHPRTFITAGACIQGFLLTAVGTMSIAVAFWRLPLGTFLDATTPGLFFAMAIGRPGCFLTGCCVGRPTRSRWGLWSSDRRLGVRRIPVQLIEASVALMIGVATLTVILAAHLPASGTIFIGAAALYTLCRQLLFPLRAEPRQTRLGRRLIMAGSALVVLADALFWITR